MKFKWHLRRREWIAMDLLLSAAAILLAYAFQRHFVFGWATSNPLQPGAFQAALIYPWFILLSMHVAGLQDSLVDRRYWFVLLRVSIAVAAALALCLLVLYFVSLKQIGRTILVRTLLLTVGFLWGARFIFLKVAGTAPRRVGCYMSGECHARFEKLIAGNHVPLEMIAVSPAAAQQAVSEFADLFAEQEVEEVVVSTRDNERELWLACLNRKIQVTDMTHFVEREYYKVPCDDIDLTWFLRFDLKWNHPFYHRFKRMMDVSVSALGLFCAAPLLLVSALAIVIEGGGAVFYSQIRVGFRGRPYRIWKLRTMRSDAESNGAQWAKKGDLRVTRVGRILRLTRIDELPQFWNVLKGEMSFIGPRPERPEFVEKLAQEIPMYHHRHWIQPGITGWAQINYPYGASLDDAREKLCYDLFYLKNASLLLDLHITLRTIGAIMKGAR